ncbi:MAG: YbeD family protein [Burkholderiaceae bacterium]
MTNDINQSFDRIEALLEFPADFPIKVIGEPVEDFVETIGSVVTTHVPSFDVGTITQSESRSGRFVSLTVQVQVESREQLQTLYMTLAEHKMVKLVI